MSKVTSRKSFASLLALALFVAPLFAGAADFQLIGLSPAVSKTNKVSLIATVGGVAAKGSSVAVPAGTPITLTWAMPTGWKGCWSNWQDTMITQNGTITATLPATIGTPAKPLTKHTFVISCFGIGRTQTSAVSVTVVKPDVTVASFSVAVKEQAKTPAVAAVPPVIADRNANPPIVGKPGVAAKPATFIANTYYTGEGVVTFKAAIKNSGKTTIPAGTGIKVHYEAMHFTPQLKATYTPSKVPDSAWILMNEANLETSAAIAPNATANVMTYIHTAGEGGPWYFRVRADSSNLVKESNENNNIKNDTKPYNFLEKK